MAEVPSVLAQLIPADRLVNWQPGVTVGVPGGIPTNRTNLIDVTKPPYNADKTGVTNASPAIQAAINAAVSNDVVYLPAGTYRLNATLAITKSGITLRGAGSNTRVLTYGNAGFVYVGSGSDYLWTVPTSGNTITAGLTKGSTSISIPDTSAFIVGNLACLTLANDTNLPVISVFGFSGVRRQLTRVTSKTSSNLFIWPPLYGDYSAVTARVNVARFQSAFVGIEDIDIDASNAAYPYTIFFEQCYASWIKNVTTHLTPNYHMMFYGSLNCEVRRCYLDRLNHVGSNGAGMILNGCAGSLFEDNIIYRAFPLVEVNYSSSGNVFAYNFMEDSSAFGVEGSGIDSNHGPHNSFNLYEGNVAPNLQCDGYFGGTSHDTVFRNWFHGREPGITNAGWTIVLNRFTRYYSIIGNILGNSNYVFTSDGVFCGNPNLGNGASSGFGPPWTNAVRSSGAITASQSSNTVTSSASFFVAADIGRWITYPDNSSTAIDGIINNRTVHVTYSKSITNTPFMVAPGTDGYQELDTNVLATLIKKGNWNFRDHGIPAAESLGTNTLPNSLYLTNKPAWWPPTVAWPPIGPDVPGVANSIPAQTRYYQLVGPTNLRVIGQ